MNIEQRLNERYSLNPQEYDQLLYTNGAVRFGTRNIVISDDILPHAREVSQGRGDLVLKQIKDYHREYEWL